MGAALLLAAGCGGGGSPGSSPSPSAPATTAASASPTATATGSPNFVNVVQVDYKFVPSTIKVTSGGSVFVLVINNQSKTLHNFSLVMKGSTTNYGNIKPGEQKVFPIKVSAGSYSFYCVFHKSLGMTGTLVVS